MPYSDEQIQEMNAACENWWVRSEALWERFLVRNYQDDRSKVLSAHGVARRLTTLKRCIERVFDLLPPQEEEPERQAIDDAAIFLQAFIINSYGIIDNFARLLVWEAAIMDRRGRPLPDGAIGLTPKCERVREGLSPELQGYLAEMDEWFEYLENYRHALAHRIPLYIPPRRMNENQADEFNRLENAILQAVKCHDFDRLAELRSRQSSLGVFEPLMMHSYGPTDRDGRPMWFHGQIICDLATVVELGEKVTAELDLLTERGRE